MPAYNFVKRMAPLVKARVKRQTIRAKRKNRPRPGQTAYCFEGMRTKACRRLGKWKILRVDDVKILAVGVLLNGGAVYAHSLNEFARRDGFENWPDMQRFFLREHGLPFAGDLIRW
jgi:hypothetical protein